MSEKLTQSQLYPLVIARCAELLKPSGLTPADLSYDLLALLISRVTNDDCSREFLRRMREKEGKTMLYKKAQMVADFLNIDVDDIALDSRARHLVDDEKPAQKTARNLGKPQAVNFLTLKLS